MRRKSNLPLLASSVSLGALTMYFFDPVHGHRRRVVARDKAWSAFHEFVHASRIAARDFKNRSVGLWKVFESYRHEERDVDDSILAERIRAKLGRFVSHPHALHIEVSERHAIFSGHILKDELEDFLAVAKVIPGIRSIESRLNLHESAAGVPSLQGGYRRPGISPDILQHKWAPSTRAMAGLVGVALVGLGVSRRGFARSVVTLAGALLLIRSIGNRDFKELLGVGSSKKPVRIHKTININAPRHAVYEFWLNLENFARVMPDVKEVRPVRGSILRWTVSGPAKIPFHWDTEISQLVTNEFIQWHSLAGAIVPNHGSLRFSDNEDGSTRVDLNFAYLPPGGVLGDKFAKIFGADAQSKFDTNFVRIKNLFEVGRVDGQMIEDGRVVDVNPGDLH